MPRFPRVLKSSTTLIVAASNSLHPERADYQCDGTADDVEIQAALDALPATGGRVILLDGTYNTIANITVPATSALEGQSFNTIIIPAGAAITNGIVLNGNNIKLANFKITLAAGCGTGGARPNVVYAIGMNHLLIENMYLVGDKSVADDGSNLRQCGILFDNVDDSEINTVWSEDNMKYGIHLYNGSDYNVVNGCRSQGNAQSGIYIYTSSNNNTITGNICQSNGNGIIVEASSSYNTITGNTCLTGGNGIFLFTSADNNTITGNTLQNCGGTALYMYNSGYNTITGNTIQGNTTNGVYFRNTYHNTIAGNSVQGNGNSGIYLRQTTYSTIIGNTCRGNTHYGLYIYSSTDNNTIIGNICVDNDSGDTNTYDGINVTTSNYNIIEGNKCYITVAGAKQRYGINIASGTGNIVRDNDLLQGGRTSNFNDAGTGTLYYDSKENTFMDLLAVSTNHVVAAQDLTAAKPITCTIAAQPDKPRNVTITITDVDVSISAFTITVTGINTKGESTTEQFLFAGGLTQTGNTAFAHVTSVVVDSMTGAAAGDVLDVGIGSKLGVTGTLHIAGDIYHVSKNNADYPAASYTVDLTYDTVDVSTGGAINAGDDFHIWLRASRNQIK